MKEERILKLYNSGLTRVSDIAQKTQMSTSSVYYYLNRNGKINNTKPTTEQLEQVQGLYDEGYKTKEIVETMNVDRAFVVACLRKLKLKISKNYKTTPETLERFKKLYLEENLSRQQISSLMGLTLGQINAIVVKNNIVKRKDYGGADEIKRLYIDQGMGKKEISEKLGIKISTINSCLQNNKIKKSR